MECNLSHWLYAVLYGEAHRCRLPLLPSSENVFGGNGTQRVAALYGRILERQERQEMRKQQTINGVPVVSV